MQSGAETRETVAPGRLLAIGRLLARARARARRAVSASTRPLTGACRNSAGIQRDILVLL